MVIEKWCIKRENISHETINSWFNKMTTHNFKQKSDKQFDPINHKYVYTYLHYPAVNNKFVHNYIVSGYTEITYDEFLKFIFPETNIKLLKSKTPRYNVIRKEN